MAAPVGVAQALPRLDAGAVYTAGVGDALVAVLALPAIQTPVRHTESHAVSLAHTHTEHSGIFTKSQRGQIIPVATEHANILIFCLFQIPSQAIGAII